MTDETTTFDSSVAEDAVQAYMEKILGPGGLEMFESHTPGVIAFERLDAYDEPKIDWGRFAEEVGDAVGVKVVDIAHCDWSFDDRCDEEATLIAFDVPGLPDDYRDDYRNKLKTDPESGLSPRM